MTEGFRGPGGGFVGVTRGARVGDIVFVCGRRRDEGKSMGADLDVGKGSGDFGHMASDAAAAG